MEVPDNLFNKSEQESHEDSKDKMENMEVDIAMETTSVVSELVEATSNEISKGPSTDTMESVAIASEEKLLEDEDKSLIISEPDSKEDCSLEPQHQPLDMPNNGETSALPLAINSDSPAESADGSKEGPPSADLSYPKDVTSMEDGITSSNATLILSSFETPENATKAPIDAIDSAVLETDFFKPDVKLIEEKMQETNQPITIAEKSETQQTETESETKQDLEPESPFEEFAEVYQSPVKETSKVSDDDKTTQENLVEEKVQATNEPQQVDSETKPPSPATNPTLLDESDSFQLTEENILEEISEMIREPELDLDVKLPETYQSQVTEAMSPSKGVEEQLEASAERVSNEVEHGSDEKALEVDQPTTDNIVVEQQSELDSDVKPETTSEPEQSSDEKPTEGPDADLLKMSGNAELEQKLTESQGEEMNNEAKTIESNSISTSEATSIKRPQDDATGDLDEPAKKAKLGEQISGNFFPLAFLTSYHI